VVKCSVLLNNTVSEKMKYLAYGLIILTLLLAAQAVEQQITGRAEVSSPGRSFRINVADRDSKPEEYTNLMTYQWIRAILPACAGLFLLYLIRRSDRLDPFSPHFQGNAAIDDLSKHLEDQNKR